MTSQRTGKNPSQPDPFRRTRCSRGLVFCANPHLSTSPLGVGVYVFTTDNWLLTNDQRSLVLTDFGSCVDSLRPQPIPSPTIPSSPPVDGAVDSAACAKSESEAHVITSDIVTAPSTSPLTSPLPLHLPSASCSGSNDAGTSTESGTESGTRLVSAERGVGTTNASLGEEAASGPGGKSLDVVGGALPTSATEGGDGSDASSVATSAATATTEERRRKRPCVAKESHEGSGPSGGKNEREAWSSSRRSRRDMSEGLVFPFCEYFSAGTPSFLAPELDRAWRERGVMDFRRSDVRDRSPPQVNRHGGTV